MGVSTAALVSAVLALLALVFILPPIAATCKGWSTLHDFIVLGGGSVNCGTTGCSVCGDQCNCCRCEGFDEITNYPIKDSSRAAIAFDVLAFILLLPALVLFALLAFGKFSSAKYVAIPLMIIAALFTIIAWGAYVGKLKETGRGYTLRYGFALSVLSSLLSIAGAIVGIFIKV